MEKYWVKDVKQILNVPKDDLEVHFILELEKYDKSVTRKIIESFDSLIRQGFKITLSINAYQRNFTAIEIGLFVVFENQLKEIGVPLYFSNAYKHTYTLQELIHADEVMDDFINRLKESSLSPLEKYLVIYNHLTEKTYRNDVFDESASRDILSIINGNKIVCEGFAELMEYYCENVGIKSMIQELAVVDRKGRDNHANNLILINDDKYHIHGLYYCDATWDSHKDEQPGKCYAFCLIPLNDVPHIKIEIKLYQPFPIFYNKDYPGRSNCLVDGYYQVLLGRNAYLGDDYQFEFETGFLENEFGLKNIEEETYNLAIHLLVTRGREVALKLLDILKEEGVDADIYHVNNVPQGSSLPYLIALLLFNDNNSVQVKKALSFLMKNKDYVLSNVDYGNWPRSDIENVYERLEKIADFNFEEIKISYEEFDKLIVETRRTDYNRFVTLDFVWNVVEKARLGRALFLAIGTIRKQYPVGKPISQEVFTSALYHAFRFAGLNKKEAESLIENSIIKSQDVAQVSYDDEAINCWKKTI